MSDYIISRIGTDEAVAIEDELTRLYVAVYNEPPYNGHGVYNEEGFRSRNASQLRAPGFSLVTARTDGDELAGFAFGFTMSGDRFWSGVDEPARVKGRDKFAWIELVVAAAHRGRGLSHRLRDELLSDRPEPFATLCAHPDAEPARSMYERWGWQKVTTIGLADDQADIMLLDLSTNQARK
ncbi:GNAT family N-acetyltransferase [Actinomadura rupiterrae]|uniref:GNAT family N-acetyltransferase n=1 Tax=Actinomadura rupiterrae TaxID=559627 RepID=UPI0020A2C7A8|nr:GNAT family N-acetyltransferase [Actinomadura rupiterrae]MCP2337556.1 ribosomal protein S18 acetylase RimI-like enzyme [Actinomadura rupiterrae]